MDEREGSERRSEMLVKKFHELFGHLSTTLGVDLGGASIAAFDTVISKVKTFEKSQEILIFIFVVEDHRVKRR